LTEFEKIVIISAAHSGGKLVRDATLQIPSRIGARIEKQIQDGHSRREFFL